MINLVLQSFGREGEYKRAILTILSFYAHTSLPLHKTRIILFTDKTEYFSKSLFGLPISYVILTPDKIRRMRGEIDFLHRMKIALIEEAFTMIEGNMLYADSDTFFVADPAPIVDSVTPVKSYMHLWEHKFESMRSIPLPSGDTFRAFLNLIERKSFQLSNGTYIEVRPTDVSWNAGVMIFHPSHARFIPDVFALTDQFFPVTLNHASEQYAFSIMLQKYTELKACDDVIYHYWYRVKKQIIDLFLEKKLTAHWSEMDLNDKLTEVKKWSEYLPHYLDNHILTLKDQAVQNFNEKNYKQGYQFTAKVLMREFVKDKAFLKHVLYFTKKAIS